MNRILLILVVTLLLNPAFAAEKFKVATVDAGKIMQNYDEARKALEAVQKGEAALKDKVAAKRKLIDAARAQNKTETELQMMAEQYKLEIEPEAMKLEQDTKVKSEKIQESVRNAIKAIATEQKYDAVLVQEAVLFGATDITDLILGKLTAKK